MAFPLDDLLAAYRAEEASGSLIDATAAHRDLPILVSSPGSAAGKIGLGRTFSGSQRSFYKPGSGLNPSSGAAIGICGWIFENDLLATHMLAGFSADTTPFRNVLYLARSTAPSQAYYAVCRTAADAAVNVQDTHVAPATGVWTLLMGWYDPADPLGASVSVAVNDQAPVRAAVSALYVDPGGTPSYALSAGQIQGTGAINHTIDMVMVHARAYSAGDRAILWNGGAGIDPFTGRRRVMHRSRTNLYQMARGRA